MMGGKLVGDKGSVESRIINPRLFRKRVDQLASAFAFASARIAPWSAAGASSVHWR